MTIRTSHISIVAETFAPEINGVAHTLGRLVASLRQRGHRVTIVRPRQRTYDGAGDEAGLTLVRGVPLPASRGLQAGLPAAGLLRRAWTRDRPDAVYVATEGPLGWSAVSAARALGIRVLSGFHTNFHCYARHYRLGVLKPVIHAYLAAFHRRTDGTLTASADVRDELRTAGVDTVHVLGRGVDSDLFTPERRCARLRHTWGASEAGLVALYVGRLAPEKDLPLAVAAFRAIQRVSPDATFVVVGDGPERAALQRRHPDLIFTGVRTGEDLARHYASADLFLFPSATDTFGNVTLEAMASGLAVVAFDYAAAHHYISHGRHGLLAARHDRDAFVRHAVSAACAPRHVAVLRQAARVRVAGLGWAGVADRFAALLLDAQPELRADVDLVPVRPPRHAV